MATLDLTRTSLRPSSPPLSSEGDLYAAVANAWYRMHRPGWHIRRPMQPYVFGPHFAQSTESQRRSVREEVIAVCAQIVSLYRWVEWTRFDVQPGAWVASC